MLLVISQEVLCRILSFCLKPRFASIVVAVSRYLRQTVVLPLSWVSSHVIADSHMSDYQLFCLGRILLLADSVAMQASEAQSGLLLNCNLRLFWRGRYPYFWQRNRWIMPIGMGMDRCFVQSKPSLLTSLSCLLSWVGELRGFYIGLTSAVSSTRLTTAALHGARRRDREDFLSLHVVLHSNVGACNSYGDTEDGYLTDNKLAWKQLLIYRRKLECTAVCSHYKFA